MNTGASSHLATGIGRMVVSADPTTGTPDRNAGDVLAWLMAHPRAAPR
jgi:hypothetical protein